MCVAPNEGNEIGHYEGRSIRTLKERREQKTLTAAEALFLDWMELVQKLGPEMAGR